MHFVSSLCVSSTFSRPRILLIEKSVSFREQKTGAKGSVRIGGLGVNSRDFLEGVESTREATDLILKLSITAVLINLFQ